MPATVVMNSAPRGSLRWVHAVTPSLPPRTDITGCVGCKITVASNNDLTVTSLGRWKFTGNAETHTLTVKDADHATVVTGSLDLSSVGTVGGFAYASVTPVVLNRGLVYYLYSSETNGGDGFSDITQATVSGDATLVIASTEIPCGSNFAIGSSGAMYGPIDFQYLLGDRLSHGILASEGDSLLIGGATTPALDTTGLVRSSLTGYGGHTFCLGGSTVAMMTARAGILDGTYWSGHAINLLLVLIGRNDYGADPATIFAALKSYCQARMAIGWTVCLCTLPSSTPGHDWDLFRDPLNALILGDPTCYDVVADLAATSELGPTNAYQDTTYFVDGIHMADAGHAVAASVVEAAIAPILP